MNLQEARLLKNQVYFKGFENNKLTQFKNEVFSMAQQNQYKIKELGQCEKVIFEEHFQA